jgi:hypothetical protein
MELALRGISQFNGNFRQQTCDPKHCELIRTVCQNYAMLLTVGEISGAFYAASALHRFELSSSTDYAEVLTICVICG